MRRAVLILGMSAVSLFIFVGKGGAAVLDIPGSRATLSGIGVISGWKCEATGALTVRFDGGEPIPLLHGAERGDTRRECGDVNNGFVAIMNWALLGDGEHTAVAYEDDTEFARSTFTVVTTGEEFVTDARAQCSVPDFPAPGENVSLEWEESTQRFELARVTSYRLLSGAAEVVDADTLTIGAERIRLVGIDAPESQQLCLNATGECYPCGQVATDALRQKLIGNNTVSCYLGDRDIYGRALGICFSFDGTDLNGWLVANGRAVAYRYYSSRYIPQEAIVSAAQRGIWAGQFVVPSRWRRGERLVECQGEYQSASMLY